MLLGDVINLSIGQGLLAATPMQLAVGYASVRQRRLRDGAPGGAGDLPAEHASGGEPGYVDFAPSTRRSSSDGADRSA